MVVPYLHLNIQHNNAPLPALLLNRHLARAISVAPKLCVLDEPVRRNQVLELSHVDKVVLDGVRLARPRLARRVRHAQREGVRVPLAQHRVQRALADARGARDDDGATVSGLRRGGHCAGGGKNEVTAEERE